MNHGQLLLVFGLLLRTRAIVMPSSNIALLSSLRKPLVMSYDTNKYPFREALLAIMEDDALSDGHPPLPTADLSKLHTFSDHKCSHYEIDKSGNAIAFFQSKWNKNRDKQGETYKRELQSKDSDKYLFFERLYQSFIEEVVGPSIGGGTILYQRAPTFRCFLGRTSHPCSSSAMGKMHNDEDYHHQPSELNLWMPISDHVGGNNSLWVESFPALGDFAPLELSYGQVYRGYLNQCRHYTNANDTPYTRVSVDFRVLNAKTGGHDATFHEGVRRGAKARFQKKFDVGGFYNVLQCPEEDIGAEVGREKKRELKDEVEEEAKAS